MSIQKVPKFLTECLMYAGCGVIGLISVASKGSFANFVEYVGMASIGTGILMTKAYKEQKLTLSKKDVVVVTGCDSGLGFNLALKCNNLNTTVVATCLNKNSDGIRKLKELCDPERLHVVELDITRAESILLAHHTVASILKTNDLKLSAFVNNAGIMCFGEFEWQTDSLLQRQLNTNLFGTMSVTKQFLSLIRKHKSRIINVTSHCALEALPGLAPYAASKAGLRFWNDALRVEMKKYSVDVVNFIPGSFFMDSNITAKQDQYAFEMAENFTEEQSLFYGKYFDTYNSYLKSLSGVKPIPVYDHKNEIMKTFASALIDKFPSATYKCEPMRYKVYHWLFKIAPTEVRDWLVTRFMMMPKYCPPIKGN